MWHPSYRTAKTMTSFSSPPIRQAVPADAAWIIDFLRERWNATMIAVHDETIDPAALPAFSDPRARLALA